MKVYLLDTNIWSDWYRKEKYIDRHITKLLGTKNLLNMSSITLGEFSYGWHLDSSFNRDLFENFLKTIKFTVYCDFDNQTTEIYGRLRAILTKTYDPQGKNRKWLDTLEDPTTSKKLGIQENDLLITAQAIKYGMTLVTADKKIKRIFDIIPEEYIGNKNNGFYFEIWDKA
ncbi:MAG: type II toxin-antitoxin system VapC family toxin [Sedimentisphaerales bacterium]|nr:type II toxin-antitoxin system VapC family toxin [Sedimentisphaerales bacterium]